MEKYEDWVACHPINPQWTIRNATGVYFDRVVEAGLFSAEVNVHLLIAAQEYRVIFENWREFYKLLGHHAPEGAGKIKERRQAGAAIAQEWLAHENKAVASLKEALDLLV